MKKILFALLFSSLACYSQDSLFVDCYGTPSPENWLGDGYCDDGSYSWNGNPIHFDCEEFGYDGGDCEIPLPEGVYGCTDSEAPNFNPWADYDDDSCVGVSCSNGESKMILQLTLDQFPGETGWILTDITTGQPVANVVAGEYSYEQSNQTIVYDLCVPETGVELILSDTYGDGLAGSMYGGGSDGSFIMLGDAQPCGSLDTLWSLPEANFGGAAYSGPIWLQQCDIPAIEGCTNNTYVEFNFQANLDDGSCETLHTLGCVNPDAFNYNPQATLNEIIPTCNYTLIIEDDGGDGWGDSYIGVVQEDSIIGTYTIGPGYYSQEFDIVLETDKAVKVYYFEIASPQTPPAEVAFQTMHNSFTLINSHDIITLQGGAYPFADNGGGALQPYEPPFWNVYSALPFCGDYCVPTIYGCLDEQSLNYNPEANTSDNSCIEIVEGCTSPFAFNYDSIANVDDGSCVAIVYGCMDSNAWNYNPFANTVDESCIYFGCMDSLADNYDPMANVELEGACFTTILGCTDPEAFNYNEEANTEDFSCIPVVFGCMDSTAFNYDPIANTEGDCLEIIEGCMDVTAFNYDMFANTEAECLYDAGCVGEPGEPYWLNDTCYAWVIMVDPYCCNTDWDEKCQALYWSCSWDSPLDTRDLLRSNDVVIYPNPMSDVLNILTNGPVSIEVYDITGKLVIRVKESQTTEGLNQLDVGLLPAGIYSFSITYEGVTSNQKLFKR
jgi:hypothetical protein